MNSLLHRFAQRLVRRAPTVPPVTGVADAAWYDSAYGAIESYSRPFWRSHYYFIWSVMADRIRAAQARRIVDIGCGPGQLAACLFDLTDIEEYTGVDFSAQAIAMAQQACPRGRYIVGDATTTTIHDDVEHDLVTCTEVLEHVPADHSVIARFKPHVRCLCTVPNFDYASHVRYFRSVDEVTERYGRFFDDFDVWALRGTRDHVFYLFDGIRNNHGSEPFSGA